MLVTSKEILIDAQKNGYAVGAFNVENMEMVMAVLKAAEEMDSPVIMQTTPGTLKFAGIDFYFANIKAAAERSKIPVVCHLDHGDTFEIAASAFRKGYTSIMIDGSKLPFEENVSLTRDVVRFCHAGGVPVEAELGHVGGKEDNADGTLKTQNPFTDPEEAVEFVKLTECDSLAIGIGTAHGIYKGTPQINFEVLKKIRSVINIPLVLHGTSGVPDDQVVEAIKNGMCKVNYATDLRIAYTEGIKEYMNENPKAFDPKKYGAIGIEKVKNYVKRAISLISLTR